MFEADELFWDKIEAECRDLRFNGYSYEFGYDYKDDYDDDEEDEDEELDDDMDIAS